jgi:hypothetical protein
VELGGYSRCLNIELDEFQWNWVETMCRNDVCKWSRAEFGGDEWRSSLLFMDFNMELDGTG